MQTAGNDIRAASFTLPTPDHHTQITSEDIETAENPVAAELAAERAAESAEAVAATQAGAHMAVPAAEPQDVAASEVVNAEEPLPVEKAEDEVCVCVKAHGRLCVHACVLVLDIVCR